MNECFIFLPVQKKERDMLGKKNVDTLCPDEIGIFFIIQRLSKNIIKNARGGVHNFVNSCRFSPAGLHFLLCGMRPDVHIEKNRREREPGERTISSCLQCSDD